MFPDGTSERERVAAGGGDGPVEDGVEGVGMLTIIRWTPEARRRINASCLLNTEPPAGNGKQDHDGFRPSPAIRSTAPALTILQNIRGDCHWDYFGHVFSILDCQPQI